MQSPVETHLQINLNGVCYALGSKGSCRFRLASLDPGWQEDVRLLDASLPAGQLQALAEKNIFLAPDGVPSSDFALMCCGLGSAWPGMGRDLYASFPEARRAMDKVAALADWDLLALMDEPDIAVISQTRWQIPYLFMLEYGQWAQIVSMGFSPAVICGHSLGELIALCLAGVLSLESAWILLDTRAEHMAELEAKGGRQGGMLAAPAPLDAIAPVLSQYPDLRISNRNTDRQYVLSGPREQLLEARRQLRKKRIPAVMLGMGLAFHNPAMRILRDMSLRRLGGLAVHGPQIPMLSCVDACEYPSDPNDIYVRIADLDENMVDWPRLAAKLTAADPGQSFLELGPQETLCSITSELAPLNACLAVDRKGNEAQAMRIACARLFAAGVLNESAMAALARDAQPEPLPVPALKPREQAPQPPAEYICLVRELVSGISGRPASEISLDMELRQDLNIRSSALPFLLLEAERRLGKSLPIENVFQLSTVGDLARLAAGIIPPAQTGTALPGAAFAKSRIRFTRHVLHNGNVIQCPIDLAHPGFVPGKTAIIASSENVFIPWAVAGAAAAGSETAILKDNNSRQLQRSLRKDRWQGIVFLLDGQDVNDFLEKSSSNTLKVLLEYFCSLPEGHKPWLMLFAPMDNAGGAADDAAGAGYFSGRLQAVCDFSVRFSALLPAGTQFRIIGLSGGGPGQNGQDWADMLTLELLHGAAVCPGVPLHGTPGGICGEKPEERVDTGCCPVFWTNFASEYAALRTCPGDTPCSAIEPVADFSGEPDGSVFLGSVQFPASAGKAFGPDGSPFNPAAEEGFDSGPWLLPGTMLETMACASSGALPWLQLTGFTDLRIFCLPALPTGVIRQGRIRVSSRVALPLEGVFTRCCRVRIDLDNIRTNGRRSGSSRLLSDGVCLRARQMPPVRPIWPEQTDESGCAQESCSLQQWLGLQKKLLGPVSPITMDVGGQEAQGFEADILPCGGDSFCGVNAALLGALWTIAHMAPSPGFGRLRLWRFSSIGFIRLQADRNYRKLQWRVSWHDDNLLRFDVQAIGAGGQALATLHSLEFDRAASAAGSEGGL